MDCPVCFEKYQLSGDHQPFTVFPCGHSLCQKCLNSLLTRDCPNCMGPITGKVVCFGMMNMIEKKEENKNVSGSVNELTKNFIRSTIITVNPFSKKIEELNKKINEMIEKKKRETASTKSEIEHETQMKIDHVVAVLTTESENLLKQCKEKEQRNTKFLSNKQKQINEYMAQQNLLDSVGKVNEMNGKIEKLERELENFDGEQFNFVPVKEQTVMDLSTNNIGRINVGSQISTINNQERMIIPRGPNLANDIKK